MFTYSSTCFGRPHAQLQELNNCSSSLWLYSRSVVIAVLLVVVGPGRPDRDQQHCYQHAPVVKSEAATAVVELPTMGVRMPETCWAVCKRQVMNLRNCCIWLVDLFELIFWNFMLAEQSECARVITLSTQCARVVTLSTQFLTGYMI